MVYLNPFSCLSFDKPNTDLTIPVISEDKPPEVTSKSTSLLKAAKKTYEQTKSSFNAAKQTLIDLKSKKLFFKFIKRKEYREGIDSLEPKLNPDTEKSKIKKAIQGVMAQIKELKDVLKETKRVYEELKQITKTEELLANLQVEPTGNETLKQYPSFGPIPTCDVTAAIFITPSSKEESVKSEEGSVVLSEAGTSKEAQEPSEGVVESEEGKVEEEIPSQVDDDKIEESPKEELDASSTSSGSSQISLGESEKSEDSSTDGEA